MKLLSDMNLSPRWVNIQGETGLAVTHNEKPSVVQIPSDNVDPDIIGPPVITALYQMSEELSNGAVVTIDTKRTRLRLLPFPKNE